MSADQEIAAFNKWWSSYRTHTWNVHVRLGGDEPEPVPALWKEDDRHGALVGWLARASHQE
jgi:hypothetical protein